MGDFSNFLTRDPKRGVLSPFSLGPLGDLHTITGIFANTTAGAWTANRAVYMPVTVQQPVTVTDMIVTVTTQNGNLDVGIYDFTGALVVSSGSTAVAAAGTQVVGIADTALTPGLYYLGFSCSSATAVFRYSALTAATARVGGVREQASAFPLPSPATMADYATALMPNLVAAYRATI